jgi:hypothetical protein
MVRGEGGAQDALAGVERLGVAVAQPLEDLRAVFDVGEEERHRACRQVLHAA